ncbi:hypothetical protein L0F63_003374 [Massospora cicadina]|nr:hypothetical protein L0F63_003374 [Massospora cicadina]
MCTQVCKTNGTMATDPEEFKHFLPRGQARLDRLKQPAHCFQPFFPPRDLALHLARVHHSRPHPLALHRSTICYCLIVDYGRLFPYANKAIIDLATAAFAPAGFIDFRPFKGYFDVGFHSE